MQFALFARDVLRLPVKIVFTSAAQRRHSAYPRWLISRMDAVIATTKTAASFVPNVRAVIPHGVDTDWFQPAEDRARAWQATGFPGRAGIATVGRVRPEKGTDRFVDAMVSALPGLPDVTALIIGKATPEFTAFEADLKARVKAAGLSHRIIFTGEMTAEQMRTIYPALSVLVAVPRYEGYGMTVLEAMAADVPVVASDTGNFSELVEEGMSGHIVPGGDPGAVAAAVRLILTDDGKVAGMGGAGRRSAVDRFSVAAEAAGIGGVYEALFTEAALRRSR
jgi:mannosyltransferase